MKMLADVPVGGMKQEAVPLELLYDVNIDGLADKDEEGMALDDEVVGVDGETVSHIDDDTETVSKKLKLFRTSDGRRESLEVGLPDEEGDVLVGVIDGDVDGGRGGLGEYVIAHTLEGGVSEMDTLPDGA